ncbi:AMP-binding protein [Cellulomonas soli]
MSTLMTSPSDPAAVWTDLDPDTDAPAGAAHLDRARHPAAISWTVLARRALQIASGLHAAGVRRGDRVSVILPPGPERTAVAYACWRLGAVVVATAPELTLRQEVQAHAAARPQVVVADSRGLLLTRALRSPRLRIATDRVPLLDELALGARYHLADLVTRRLLLALPTPPAADDDAALVFAPAPGEPVGVYYTQSDLGRLREIAAPEVRAVTATSSRPVAARRSALRAGSALVAAALVAPTFA